MSNYIENGVAFSPNAPFSVKIIKVTTNDLKNQLTFHSLVKHDSGSIPEDTTVLRTFLKSINSKNGTSNPIWFNWNNKTGELSFTMEIEPSENSDVKQTYVFETAIISGTDRSSVTYTALLAAHEPNPIVKLVNTTAADDILKVALSVTRGDGRQTKEAIVVGGEYLDCVWDKNTSELVVSFKLSDISQPKVSLPVDLVIGIVENSLKTTFSQTVQTTRSRKMRSRVIGGFVKNGVLTFTANFKWASTGKAPNVIDFPTSLDSAINIPSGTAKLFNVEYDPETGDMRGDIKVVEDKTKPMLYSLGMVVSSDNFNNVDVSLDIQIPAGSNKYGISYGSPYVTTNGKLLVPITVTDVNTSKEVPADTLVDYQPNPLMSKGTYGIRSPFIIKDHSGKACLSWGISPDKDGKVDVAILGIYTFSGNEFLYDIKLVIGELAIQDVVSEVKGPDVVSTITLSKEVPGGSVTLFKDPSDKWVRSLQQTSGNTIKVIFHEAARTFEPVTRSVGAGLVLGSDYGRVVHFSDTVELYMKPGPGELINKHVGGNLVNGDELKVVSYIEWDDGTVPQGVVMDPTVDTPSGSIPVTKYEYCNKEGILRYYVPVAATGLEQQFTLTPHIKAPKYNITLADKETVVTVGSNFYPYVLGKIESSLVSGNKVKLSFPINYLDGTQVVDIKNVISVKDKHTGSVLEHSDFEYKDGRVSVQVVLRDVSWDKPTQVLDFRLEDGIDQIKDKVGTGSFKQLPTFDVSLESAGLRHSGSGNNKFTELTFDIIRNDNGKTKSAKYMGGKLSSVDIVSINFSDGLTVGVIKTKLISEKDTFDIIGSLDFMIDGHLVKLDVREVYRTPGKPILKQVSKGIDPNYPLEVTWIIGDWSSIPAEYISINNRQWKNLINCKQGEPVSEWNPVAHELTVKFPGVMDPTELMTYGGINTFMLPSPDMTVYQIEFDGTIEGTEPKPKELSGSPAWNPNVDFETGLVEFRYKFANTKGNSVGNIQVVGVNYMCSGKSPNEVPVSVKQAGGSFNIKLDVGELAEAVMFDITFKSDNAPNYVTIRDGLSMALSRRKPSIIHAEILPKSDVMRVHWYNPGIESTDAVWEGSGNVRLSKGGITKDDRTNILYSDHIVFMDEYQDVRHSLRAVVDQGIVFEGVATIPGTRKPYTGFVAKEISRKETPEFVEVVYGSIYLGTDIGPQDVVGKVVNQTGTFSSFTIKGNSVGRTITVRINKYPAPHPTGFTVDIELRDGKANAPSYVTVRV